jgi:stage II sporulation protein D
MKRMFRLGLVILGIMVIVPVFAVVVFREKLPAGANLPGASEIAGIAEDAGAAGAGNYGSAGAENSGAAGSEIYTAPAAVRLRSGEIIPMREFVIGAVFAEMAADFPAEALKAQALAILTCTVRETVKHAGDPFDIDEDFYRDYFTEGMARAFYTDGYDLAYAKISSAVDSIMGEVIVYGDEPIAAPCFSSFTGLTETAAGVPYLTFVESPGDAFSPDYKTTASFTAAELRARFLTEAEITLGDDPAAFFKIIDTTPAGTVLTLRAGEQVITGAKFAEILNLNSPAFVIYYNKSTERIEITVTGNGDGIGLSKYGAKYMAETGSDYREIILHYFTNVQIAEILIKS